MSYRSIDRLTRNNAIVIIRLRRHYTGTNSRLFILPFWLFVQVWTGDEAEDMIEGAHRTVSMTWGQECSVEVCVCMYVAVLQALLSRCPSSRSRN